MPQTDRITGLVGNIAIKAPCRAATTANITLSGEQTIDGIACVTGDRVLVKNQTNGVQNGIYVVDTGTWDRAQDFDGSLDVAQGTQVRVNQGSVNAGGNFVLDTLDPISIDTTSLSFSRQAVNYVVGQSQTASAGQTLFVLGSTYQVGSSGLQVFVNGLRQRVVSDYAETSGSSITFTYPMRAGDEVDTYIGLSIGNLVAALASAVSILDSGDYYAATTVEGALAERVDAITPDNGDSNVTLTYGSSDAVQRWNSPLTANRTATLATVQAKEGGHFIVIRGPGATGDFALLVGPGLAVLRATGEWCEVFYDSANAAWIVGSYGLTQTAGLPTMTADVGDVNSTITVGTSSRTQRWNSPLTADRSVLLSATGAWTGAQLTMLRSEASTGNYALDVQSETVGSGVTTRLLRLAPGQACTCEFTGTTWVVTSSSRSRPNISNVVQLLDDFLGSEIDGYKWQSIIGTDAACLAPIVLPGQIGGIVRLTTGAGAGATMAVNGCQLFSALNWKASKGCLSTEFTVAINDITSVAVYIGLTDQVAALEMPFTLAAGNILTSNASDACGVLFDTAADTDDWWLVGVTADVDAAKQDTGVAPVAGTAEAWRIEITAAGQASFYRNGSLIGSAMTGAIGANIAQTPVVAAFSRSAAVRYIDIDMVNVQELR